jgi:FMN phosphatase YigB (HAD superfamily)
MHADTEAVTFDCFGTLVAVDPPEDVAAAIAGELRERDVDVPGDWATAYPEPHVDVPEGGELCLPEHVEAVLAGRGRDVSRATARAAVRAAFDREVRTREGAARAVAAAAERGPVGVVSNCTVPSLVGDVLAEADLPDDRLDAVVTSVDCGWRKPDERAFATAADALGVAVGGLTHVGDDPDADGAVVDHGGHFVDVGETPLPTLAGELTGEGRAWD